MSDLTPISPDLPELRLLAQFAGIAPSRLAAAFNNPEYLYNHITRQELVRFKDSCDRLGALQLRLVAALDSYVAHAKGSAH